MSTDAMADEFDRAIHNAEWPFTKPPGLNADVVAFLAEILPPVVREQDALNATRARSRRAKFQAAGRADERAAAARLADYLAVRATHGIPGTLIHTIPASHPPIAVVTDDIAHVIQGLSEARPRQDLWTEVARVLWAETGRTPGQFGLISAARHLGVPLTGLDSCGLTLAASRCDACDQCLAHPSPGREGR